MTDKQNIIIIGGDISGPMAAAYLGFHLPESRFEITFICPDTLDKPSWHVSTHADIRRFNRAIKIPEGKFIQSTQAAFKLGEQYIDWGNTPYINSFTDYGAVIGGISFMHLMMQQDKLAALPVLAEYALPVKAAIEGKFLPPDAKGRPIISDYDYGYHINPKRYAELLTEKAKSVGVKILKHQNDLSTAHLIINASGAPLGDDNKFISWTKYGFGQSYTAQKTPPKHDKLRLTTDITANDNGWALSASDQINDTTIDIYFEASQGEHSYECGRLDQPWSGKVLNIGASAVMIDPIMGSPLRLIQDDLARLIKLFPSNLTDPIEQQEYNRLSINTYDRLRDYMALQYKTNQASGDAWKARQNMPIPETSAHKLNMFKARGRIPLLDQDMFFKENWTPMLLGQNIIPERYDSLADSLEQSEIDTQLAAVTGIIQKAVDNMPRHEDFIARQCAAEGFAYA